MNENSCTCPGCLVPVSEIVGTLTAAEAEQWAAREGVELRRSWNGRLALAAADAAVVYERATAAAEAARARNEAKVRAVAEAAYAGISRGRPAVDGVDAAAAVMEDFYAEKLAYQEEVREELLEAERLATAAQQDNADGNVVGAFTFRPFRRG